MSENVQTSAMPSKLNYPDGTGIPNLHERGFDDRGVSYKLEIPPEDEFHYLSAIGKLAIFQSDQLGFNANEQQIKDKCRLYEWGPGEFIVNNTTNESPIQKDPISHSFTLQPGYIYKTLFYLDPYPDLIFTPSWPNGLGENIYFRWGETDTKEPFKDSAGAHYDARFIHRRVKKDMRTYGGNPTFSHVFKVENGPKELSLFYYTLRDPGQTKVTQWLIESAKIEIYTVKKLSQ